MSGRRRPLVYIVGHDITRIKLMMQKIKESHEALHEYKKDLELHLNLVRQQKHQLLESSKMTQLGEMAGGIADEINSPVSSMRQNIESLGQFLGSAQLDKDGKQNLLYSASDIASTVGHIASIVRSMRLLARDGSNDSFEWADLGMIINDSLVFFREKLKTNNIKLSVNKPAAEIPFRCRAVQVAQLLINLLNNAREAVL